MALPIGLLRLIKCITTASESTKSVISVTETAPPTSEPHPCAHCRYRMMIALLHLISSYFLISARTPRVSRRHGVSNHVSMEGVYTRTFPGLFRSHAVDHSYEFEGPHEVEAPEVYLLQATVRILPTLIPGPSASQTVPRNSYPY